MTRSFKIFKKLKHLLSSFYFQVFLPMALITLLIMGALYLFVSSYIEEAFEKHILPDQISRIITSERESLEMALDNSVKLARELAHREDIRKFLADESNGPQAVSEELQSMLQNLKDIYHLETIYLIGSKSYNHYKEDGFFKKIDLLNPRSEWFMNTLDSGESYLLNLDAAMTEEINLRVDAVVENEGRKIGLVGYGVSLSSITKHINNIDMGPMTKTLIIDGLLNVKLSNMKSGSINTPLEKIDTISEKAKKTISSAINGGARITHYIDEGGKKHYIVKDYIKESNWFLIVDFPIDTYKRPYEPIMHAIVIFSFLLLLLLQFLNYTILKVKFFNPVERLGEEMESYNVDKGFDHNSVFGESNEIKRLIHRFSYMDRLLQESYQELLALNQSLENRVDEQTRELQSKIGELARTNQELIIAKDRALSALKTRSEFISNVSHELRTPLNAIINFSDVLLEDFDEMLESDELQEDSKEYLRRIYSNSKHLLSLINDILDFSKIEAGAVLLQIECISLNEILTNVFENCRPKLKKMQKIDYRLHLEAAPIFAPVDKRRFTQIIYNLLSNATKFTQSGYVELRCIQQESGAIIEVSDSGRGIPNDKIVDIFKPFSQVNYNDKGTGLGLVIVRELCDNMNIHLEVESEIEKGSTFRLKLPPCKKDEDEK